MNEMEKPIEVSDSQYDAVFARLRTLGLDPEEVVSDESGQTTAHEHVTWLLTASDEEILVWFNQE